MSNVIMSMDVLDALMAEPQITLNKLKELNNELDKGYIEFLEQIVLKEKIETLLEEN